MVSLDSSKTGVKVKTSVYSSDADRHYDREHPWKPETDGAKGAQKFALPARPANLGTFVLDDFKEKAKYLEKMLLKSYDKHYAPKQTNGIQVDRDHPLDEDLCRPWKELEKRPGDTNGAIRVAIEKHVKESYRRFKAMNQDYAKAQDAGKQTTGTRGERMQEVRDFYHAGPPQEVWSSAMTEDELEVYKASYCYLWEMQQHSNKRGEFPFEVAHFTLCGIKARASKSGHITITNSAYKVLRMDNRMLRMSVPCEFHPSFMRCMS
jgi:cell fate (sporulation/competence/biofilm development) regulator YlbF (YheA/YmcA/DUF963 family)